MDKYYYHIYNRGAHKAKIFNDDSDYQRFQRLLYIANSTSDAILSAIPESKVYKFKRGETLVNIVAYCLMPNHFHIAIEEKDVKLTTKFLRKMVIGYTMYFNLKYEHPGTIIQGCTKKKLVDTEDYLKTLRNYIHLNPYKILFPDMQSDQFTDPKHIFAATEFCKMYPYSSYKDHLGTKREENAILEMASHFEIASQRSLLPKP